jgi:hypothetical protein
MMGIQENSIKMKTNPIPKELINKIELRVEDIQIPANDHYGFDSFLLKNVLVPYINGKRVGFFKFIQKAHYCDVRYYIKWQYLDYGFNRIVYIMLNKDDPRVIETQDYYKIVDGFLVDHDEDIELQDRKFIVKPDTKKNLQLLTFSENLKKQRKKKNNLPPHIIYDHLKGQWTFQRYVSGRKHCKCFSILKHGYVGAYLKAIDACNEITGSNHIPDLKHIDETLPSDYKTMTEKEFFDKYYKKYICNHSSKSKKQINPDDQLDLGLSLA